MIIVGADTDNTKDQRRQDKNRHPFRGRFAQIMVLANGLILTLGVSFILSIYIKDMIGDDHQHQVSVIEKSIIDSLKSLSDSTQTIAALLSSDGFKNLVISQDIIANLARFDGLVLLHKEPAGAWTARNLIGAQPTEDGELEFLSAFDEKMVAYIIEAVQENNDNVILLTSLPGTNYEQKNDFPLVKSRAFGLIKKVGSAEDDIVVGVSSFLRFIDDNWKRDNIDISKISIRDIDPGISMFLSDWNNTSEKNGEVIAKSFVFNGKKIEVSMDIESDMQEIMLKRSPFLMLIFGCLLTMIGTLYVRSNQNQAYKMALMNKALAQKNFEMNGEVLERDRLNQVLRKSERENRAIINSVSDIIFEISPEGNFLFLNETWKKVTGFSVQSSIGQNLFDMLHPQDQEQQRESFDSLVKGKKSAYRGFTRLRSEDGSYRSIDLAFSMLRQSDLKDLLVVGTISDVEERRRAEKALIEAEKKYRTIVENTAGGIYQQGTDGRYLSANPSMADILGYDSVDDIFEDIKNANHQVYLDRDIRLELLRKLRTDVSIKNVELQIIRKNGDVIWINENVRAVKDAADQVLYYEGSIEDVTQRKESEIMLREAKIESDLASRAKSEFLANMSHELRTPLNAIIGFSEIIKDEVFGPVGQRQYWEYASDIYSSGRHLLKIINDILDVARIDAGERQLNEAIIRIDKVVENCLDLVSPRAESGNMTIANLLTKDMPTLIGEEVAIKQMIMNLLSNAVKFTPNGGRISISHELDQEGAFRLSITDTGAGLTEEEIQKAMQPFGQVDSALNRSTSGAGLGLTLVSSLIHLHGGELEIFSQKGIGTTVTLVFPASRVSRDQD